MPGALLRPGRSRLIFSHRFHIISFLIDIFAYWSTCTCPLNMCGNLFIITLYMYILPFDNSLGTCSNEYLADQKRRIPWTKSNYARSSTSICVLNANTAQKRPNRELSKSDSEPLKCSLRHTRLPLFLLLLRPNTKYSCILHVHIWSKLIFPILDKSLAYM